MSLAKKLSTALSQDAEVGVKWKALLDAYNHTGSTSASFQFDIACRCMLILSS